MTGRQGFPHQKYLTYLEECCDARRRELAGAEGEVSLALVTVGEAEAAAAAARSDLDAFRRRSRMEGGRSCRIADLEAANAQEDQLRDAVEHARRQLLAAEKALQVALEQRESARNRMQEALDEYHVHAARKEEWDAEQRRLEAKREDKESSDAWNSRNITEHRRRR